MDTRNPGLRYRLTRVFDISNIFGTALAVRKGETMEDDFWYQQQMEEREQRLEDAYERARAGLADEEDWAVLRYECGLRKEKKCY